MSGLLNGKLSIVTGAASGIGRATCEALLKEGSKVAGVDISDKILEGSSDIQGLYKGFQADVSSSESVEKLFHDVKCYFNEVPQCLVNSAGIINESPITKMTEKQFDDVMNVNLKGTFLMTRGFCKLLAEDILNNPKNLNENESRGSIVNISSIIARTGYANHAGYTASKAAVNGFSKCIALEMAEYNIRCNVIMPGFIDTPLSAYGPEELSKLFIGATPLKRKGKPEEVADACVFLLSEKSSFITGTTIEVGGGL